MAVGLSASKNGRGQRSEASRRNEIDYNSLRTHCRTVKTILSLNVHCTQMLSLGGGFSALRVLLVRTKR